LAFFFFGCQKTAYFYPAFFLKDFAGFFPASYAFFSKLPIPFCVPGAGLANLNADLFIRGHKMRLQRKRSKVYFNLAPFGPVYTIQFRKS
jgi:hypothetical protein